MKTTIKNFFALPANVPGGALSRTAIVLIVMMITTATTAWAWQGSGTESDPYQIATYNDLLTLRNNVNGGQNYQNVYFVQTQDITWPSNTTWDHAIGYDYSPCFSGHYNGNGKKISGFRLTTSDAYAGLFGYIQGSYKGSEQSSVIAEVHHLTLENPTVTVTASSSTQYAGALVGFTQLCGRADNNTVTGGTVSFTGVSSNTVCYAGGLVGYWKGSLARLSGNTVVGTTISGAYVCGGLAGDVEFIYIPRDNFVNVTLNSAESVSDGLTFKREGALVGYCDHLNSTSDSSSGNYYYSTTSLKAFGQYYVYSGSPTIVTPNDPTGYTRVYTVTCSGGVTATATTAHTYNGTSYYEPGSTVTLSGGAAPEGYVMEKYTVNGAAIEGNTFNLTADATVGIKTAYDYRHFDGSGTTYTIYTLAGWNVFCDLIDGGKSFSGNTVRLNTDIGTTQAPVTRMAGSEGHEFRGTFDGKKHTLTVNISTTESNAAPFREIKGATISHLKVSGTVSGKRHTAGLVGFARGEDASVENTIEDCLVETAVSITGDDCGYLGGIVGHGLKSKLTIRGCAFTGSLTSTSYYTGGLQGWSDGNTLILQNDLFAPSSVNAANNGFHPVAIHNNGATTNAEVSNVYYTVAPTCTTSTRIAASGKQARSVSAGEHVTTCRAYLENSVITYTNSDITTFANGIRRGGTYYFGKDDQVKLKLNHDNPPTGYAFSYSTTPSGATLTGSANPYTLTMPDADVTITGSYTREQYTITYDLGGGSLPGGQSNPTSYNVESPTFTLVNPVRNGYDFAGWTGTGLTSPAMEVTITKGATGHRAYTATWALPALTDLRCIASTNVSATLSWTENGSATQWEVAYNGVLFSEGFEGGDGLPQGWTSSGDGQWTVGTGIGEGNGNAVSSAHSGNRNAKISRSTKGNQTYLITPTMDLSGLSAATLTFWMVNESWADDINALGVYYRVNGGAWNELATVTDGHSDWTEMTIELTGLAAYYQIGFLMIDNFGRNVGLDDIAIITGGQTVTTTENPYTLTGLTAKTDYEVKVRSVQGDEVSLWSPVITFTATPSFMLADGGIDNAEAIDTYGGEHANVTLSGRTLYKDGDWNTLCLPFNLTLAGSPLAGAEARTLESATLTGGTLDLQFGNPVTELVAGTPYIIKWDADLVIKSVDDWNSFASAVAAGNSYEGKLVQLDSDISVTQMVGTENCPFKGTFGGAGHTLNVSITNTNDQGTAPFRYISDATIMNVKVTGTVEGTTHCAGLVGFAWSGTNRIMNCEVAATVTCNSTHCGGILGHGKASATTISNCLFSGHISRATSAQGIIYGWGDAPGQHTIENCLAAGTYYGNSNVVDLLKKDGGTQTITNCYRRTAGGTQGDDASNMSPAVLANALNNGGADWQVVGDNVVPVFDKTPILTDPTFYGVTIDKTMHDEAFAGAVTFKGNYDFRSFTDDDRSILYMGAENTLYWPQSGATIGACRAYFQLADGITAADVNDARLFFGTNDTQGIEAIGQASSVTNRDNDAWYSLDGKRLNARPTTKGIYVRNGKKVVVK